MVPAALTMEDTVRIPGRCLQKAETQVFERVYLFHNMYQHWLSDSNYSRNLGYGHQQNQQEVLMDLIF